MTIIISIMSALNKKTFDILLALHDNTSSGKVITQRDLCEITGYSLGSVNSCTKVLKQNKTISDDNFITDEGYRLLENYKVKRAVFIAAGFGSRMVPITLNTPKPLVRVFGKRIIDTILDALVAQDIKEIYIVRGYLAEQFDALLYKYPFVKFIENPMYNDANNISSALLASHLLEGAYVCEADLLVQNPKVITKYQYQSNVLGVMKERSDDWCFGLKNGYIVSEGIGGVNQYQEVGITYIDEQDGKKAKTDIEKAFNMPGGKELYWEQTFFKVFNGNYKFVVRECKEGDVIEIDTFNELKEIDKAYKI